MWQLKSNKDTRGCLKCLWISMFRHLHPTQVQRETKNCWIKHQRLKFSREVYGKQEIVSVVMFKMMLHTQHHVKRLLLFCLFMAMKTVQIYIFRWHNNAHSPTIRNNNDVADMERNQLPSFIYISDYKFNTNGL